MGRKERASPPDEKVTVNVGPVDLGRVDLLVEEGFYASRTDAIRTAIRRLLEEHHDMINEAIVRESFTVGVVVWNRSALEAFRKRKERVNLRVIGVLRLTSDVPPDLADEVIESIRVLGHVSAPAPLRRRLEQKFVRSVT